MNALLLDFNGTLSDDEPVLCSIFMNLFAEAGKPLTEVEYYAELAGLSDPDVVEKWLGVPRPDLVERKIEAYRRAVRSGWTIPTKTVTALRDAARELSIAVVSGSARGEIEPVLRAAGLLDSISVIVAAEDVAHAKPDPEGYRRALHSLRLEADGCIAVEDSDVGVAAAKAAGLHCVAVTTTLPPERLSAADELADRFDADLIALLVSRSRG
ncbi:MAG TPA: HAD family phosphatase [Gaiellaceae bacterium]|nr:HAD family phosphatase [Gaiellaceae bacterium]